MNIHPAGLSISSYSDALSTIVMVGMVALLPGCGVPAPTQGALGVRVSFLLREQGGRGAGGLSSSFTNTFTFFSGAAGAGLIRIPRPGRLQETFRDMSLAPGRRLL